MFIKAYLNCCCRKSLGLGKTLLDLNFNWLSHLNVCFAFSIAIISYVLIVHCLVRIIPKRIFAEELANEEVTDWNKDDLQQLKVNLMK